MATIGLRQSVLDYIKNKADDTFLRLVSALARTYSEEDISEPISIKQYNEELAEAERDIEQGNSYTLEEVREIASQWGRK